MESIDLNKVKNSYQKMIKQGHLKLVEDDKLSTKNYKVKRSIPVTDIGNDFLKGSDAIIGDIKNDIGGY